MPVEVNRSGRVAVIEMHRENKRNAIDRAMADGIDAALNTLEDDDELWAGVLTGTRLVFSAGSDLASGGDYVTDRGGEYGIIRRVRRKPLIAAVEGPALGGGLEYALACDLVVASRTALFGLPEVTRGVVPTCGALFRGPRAFPLNLARELVLTGRPIDAQRCYEAGFVNLVVDEGQAAVRAIELAEQICANAPLSVRACLDAINRLAGDGDQAGWDVTVAARDSVVGTFDNDEGKAAFFERRRPEWRAE